MRTDCWSRHFSFRESQTEEQRAFLRAEFEVNWPALVAYVKQSAARGEEMRGDALFALAKPTSISVLPCLDACPAYPRRLSYALSRRYGQRTGVRITGILIAVN